MKLKQTFSVITQSALSSDEWKVLGLLYQPIIGTLGFSLYHTLYHLLNQKNYQSETFQHQFLVDLLGEKIDKLKAAKDKLEAISLLDTYELNEHIIYQLKSPLSPRGFIKDTVLGQFLKTEVGPKMFGQLTDVFRVEKIDLSEYKQVTKNFDDVFNFVSTENHHDNKTYLGKNNNRGAKISKQLDYEKFIELLPDRLKKPILMAHHTQDTIQKLVFVYGFSAEEMAEVYKLTADANGRLDLGNLAFKAQSYYEDHKKDDMVVAETKDQNEEMEAIISLKKMSPLQIVAKYGKGDYQSMHSDTVMQLLDRNQVEVGVINALLLHILKHKEGELPHINYLEKVLETWMKMGIRTTEDAYRLVLNNDAQNKEKESSSKSTSKSKKNLNPEWIQSYLDELNNIKGL
ncbi:DnaD domain protein [Acholeplasma hippikon]|uniref:DnaD domain-containing protein n=1 Tax=Acholeplasma hippikon TaxID=264636 RepID=A0A449BJL5_9MOLU|nr:DnaD domain protein [Acholeplasma hippikon]VEU82642.1 DnaD domain-containing protein [Acholeplasma hippikon]